MVKLHNHPVELKSKTKQKLDYPIIVHSHLRWDWVWQRPQQFLTRLSQNHPILFIESPLQSGNSSNSKATVYGDSRYPNIQILRTELPDHFLSTSSSSAALPAESEHKRLVQLILAGPCGSLFKNPVLWFYDPMATHSFAHNADALAIVYDCMDQLSHFDGAPPNLIERELELLKLADVVFAGGPKIHRDKSQFNPNCHCYGCGVDSQHFGKARQPHTAIPDDISKISKPVLGYFGVVDERIDYELLRAIAISNPTWNIVIIGPTAKVDSSTFPRANNIHWLGAKNYEQLPSYVKHFDICLMPFCQNRATEFINPTKALEYMAAGKPIVSSYIEDVALQFSDVVTTVHSHSDFVRACDSILAKSNDQLIERGITLAENCSWDKIVNHLKRHIGDAIATKLTMSQRNSIKQ